jgi:hypothetical protein
VLLAIADICNYHVLWFCGAVAFPFAGAVVCVRTWLRIVVTLDDLEAQSNMMFWSGKEAKFNGIIVIDIVEIVGLAARSVIAL